MERLTEKVNDYWKTNDKAHIYYLDKNESVFVGNVIDRLAEFEDFMEELGVNSLEELKQHIDYQNGFAHSLITEKEELKDFNSRLQNINIELLNQKQILPITNTNMVQSALHRVVTHLIPTKILVLHQPHEAIPL